ncbi:DNA cytosine methyltransferase (plasmid) [Pontibacillus sp. ALD_SL1]|uniref:DNA cytosine methyltransferase n=1 Tax=Pontibacillus sp. ALD_SL1 TaxID=2777185 RepID=UPI001A97662A|nr:DNA cytosine methyltransferase [Pontibacillus sp. ALD_SL1]QST02482.1 DNA cytosine methyltransferase [Pontibacillus sp. ALD_SL1]
MNIVYQRVGKKTYNGERVYLDNETLAKFGYVPGAKMNTLINPDDHTVEFRLDPDGTNTVSKKKRKERVIPVIDKSGKSIKAALSSCDHITLSIIEENGEYRVLVKGEKNTASLKKENPTAQPLTTITFCAGAGISTEAMKEAGFREVAGVEWNPKAGAEDTFSDLYQQNNPDTVLFNVPMEQLKGTDLPNADVWLMTLDCTDYSKSSNGTGKGLHTMHLFMHAMRLFWERPKVDRPQAVLLENVPEFEKVAGNALKLCFEEEGYTVQTAVIDSLEHGSRTKRKRFFLSATVHDGFQFPEPTGVLASPIAIDGEVTTETLEWITPDESKTLQYFREREKKGMKHNHYMTVFDVTRDAYVGTITKSHHKIQPENWIKHPFLENTFAYLKAEHIRSIQGVPKHLYLGDSNKKKVESMGQAVCYTSFKRIAQSLYAFLRENQAMHACAS